MTSERRPGERTGPHGAAWWIGLVLGGLVGAYGLVGLLDNAIYTLPPVWAAWLLGVLLAHDLVIAPAVLLAGWVVGRLPEGVRVPLRPALFISAVLVVMTLPAFLGDGPTTQPGNASLLPNDYARGLVVTVGLVWAVVVVVALVRAWTNRRHRGHPPELRSGPDRPTEPEPVRSAGAQDRR